MTNAIIRNPVVDREEAERLVASVSWFHRVELIPGLIAPGFIPFDGSYDAKSYIDSLGIEDIANKRILELGTWDGPLAFELGERGADIHASDIQDPLKTGFHVMEHVSGKKIPYERCSVYDLDKHYADGMFDIVLFFGVFYHLKHPILAFEKIARVLKMGGVIYTEGEGIGQYFENIDGDAVDITQSTIDILEKMDRDGIPLTLSYAGKMLGARNWILPNKSALDGWLRNAGFDVVGIFDDGAKHRRVGAKAIKVRDRPFVEHDLTGETDGSFGAIQSI